MSDGRVLSGKFFISNGTKQGGILLPYLFTRYVCDLIFSKLVLDV